MPKPKPRMVQIFYWKANGAACQSSITKATGLDVDLIDTKSGPEIFFDGVADVKIHDGVVRFALYVRHNGGGVVVGRFAIPILGLPDVIQALVLRLTEAAKNPPAAN